jgi:DNA-binding NarL/FixJ family response regulator
MQQKVDQPISPPSRQPGAAAISGDELEIDPRSNRAKIERALALEIRIRERLSQPPPTAPESKGSPIAYVLEQWRDVIVVAAQKGWTNKMIARELRAQGVTFTVSAIYQRLQKMHFNGHRASRRRPTSRTSPNQKGT